MSNVFHVAFPVRDIVETRRFYGEVLGCGVGRSAESWIDFNLYGHQVVAHLNPAMRDAVAVRNPVDGHNVPVPHFGVVLDWDEWHKLADRLKAADADFVIEPYIRFEGETGEQATMFLLDPSGNALEFKSFKDMSQLFAA